MDSGQLDDLVVVHVPGGRDDDVRLRVASVVIAGNLRHGNGADHLRLSEDPAPERMVAVNGSGEHVVNAIGRLVLVHRDLLEHHVALGVDLIGWQRRRGQHFGQQPERFVRVLIEEACVQMR